MPETSVYTLRHLETGQYLSALRNGRNYIICFTDGDSAFAFQTALGTVEHNEIVTLPITAIPDGRMWLDGEFVETTQPVNHH